MHWVTLLYCIRVGWQCSLPFSLAHIFPVKVGLQLHPSVGPGKTCKPNLLLDCHWRSGGVGTGDTPLCCWNGHRSPVPHWVLLTPRERGAEYSLPLTTSHHFFDARWRWRLSSSLGPTHRGWGHCSTNSLTSHHLVQSHWCHMGPQQHWWGKGMGPNQRTN